MGKKWGIKTGLFVTISLGIIFSGSVMAQTRVIPDDEWHHSLKIYLWGAGIDGRSAGGEEISVGFDQLVDNLEFAFMAGYEARKGRWVLQFDGMYIDLEGKKQLELIPPIGGDMINVNVEATMGLKATTLQMAGGFNFYKDTRSTTDVLLGVRYLDLSGDLSLRFDLGLPEAEQSFKGSLSGDILDGFIGLKSRIELSDRWNLLFYGDIGAGDSDMTWQAMVGATINVSKRTDIALTYRRLDWKIRGDVIHDLSYSGPMLGAIIRF